MKYRLYTEPTEAAPEDLKARMDATLMGGGTDFTYRYLRFGRNEGGFYIAGDGYPLSEASLFEGLEVVSWYLTDSGTLDRPRAGSYHDGASTGYVNTFERNNAGQYHVEWTMEVMSHDLALATELFDRIRSGTIKPTRAYRAGTVWTRLHQWYRLLVRGRLTATQK